MHAMLVSLLVLAADSEPDPWRVVVHDSALRVLRGDWEIPDALVVTFTPYWAESLGFLVRNAAATTPIIMLTGRSDDAASVRAITAAWGLDEGRVRVVPTSAETPWVRDYGPLQVFDDGELTWLDFGYESSRLGDDIVPQALAAMANVQVEAMDPSIDGGAVVSNGAGMCAITDRSLRVAGVDVRDPTAMTWVSERLGCRVVAVIPGISREPTGHADMLVQFFAPDHVGVASLDANAFPDEARALDVSAAVLQAAAQRAGVSLRVVRVPMFIDAANIHYSYLNGTRLAGRFFVPSYSRVDAKLQAEAYARLALLLGGDAMVMVPADTMAALGGAVHCVTLGLTLQ